MGDLKRARRAIASLGIQINDDSELEGLLALIVAYEEVKTSRLAAIEAQEDAALELALTVSHYKQLFNLTWRELNRSFGFPHADSAIYRLLNRTGEITARGYERIASGLNKALEDSGLPAFEARLWVNWKINF